jgi:hypothetical protein
MLSYVVADGMAAITLTATWAAGAYASTVASKKGSIPINRGDLNEWWAAMDSSTSAVIGPERCAYESGGRA